MPRPVRRGGGVGGEEAWKGWWVVELRTRGRAGELVWKGRG